MKTNFRRLAWLAALAWCCGAWVPSARAYVYIHVSVKVILGESNKWPSSTESMRLTSPAEISARVAEYNRLLDRMAWGFRLNLREVRGLGGVSEWFEADSGSDHDWTTFENAILDDRDKYAYRPDAINVYINNHAGRSVASGRPDYLFLGDLILLNQGPGWDTMLHEIGHTLSLKHTHGPCNDPDDCGFRWRDDDGCGDTLYDYPGTNRNAIAFYNFHTNNLTVDQWRQVDDLFRNLMSYHEPTQADCRLTHDQWEKMIDLCNDPLRRRIVTSGSTVFVDPTASGLSPCELLNNLADFLGGFDWPTALYRAELDGHPLSPELWFRRTCNTVQIRPPMPGRPAGYPSDWAWPPLPDPAGLFPPEPDGYPDGWPWPPTPPETLEVCVGGAYRTIGNALECAVMPGDRLQIKGGYYDEKLRITNQVTLVTDHAPGHDSVFIGQKRGTPPH